MILYTIVPVEDVLEGFEEEERTLVQADVGTLTVLVEPVGDGRGRIERILSTNPSHFLNPEMQPGSLVSLV